MHINAQLKKRTAKIVEHTALARRTIQKYITQLVSKKQIEAYGEGKGRYYQRLYSRELPLAKELEVVHIHSQLYPCAKSLFFNGSVFIF